MAANTPKPLELYLLQFLLIMLGIGAVGGGVLLILSPDGGLVRLPASMLAGSPFLSYLIPGVILLFFNGVLPLLTAYGLAVRPHWKLMNALNIDRDCFWASTFSWKIRHHPRHPVGGAVPNRRLRQPHPVCLSPLRRRNHRRVAAAAHSTQVS